MNLRPFFSPPTNQDRSLAEAISQPQNGFNLLRLLAAYGVVVFHAWQLSPVRPGSPDPLTACLQPYMNVGELAVALFFLISGMFISQSFTHDPHWLRFSLRRLARLLPALWFCLLLSTICAVVFFSKQGWPGLLQYQTWNYIVSNGFVHFLQYGFSLEQLKIPGVLHSAELNGPLWTLYWEARMYVMVALIGMLAMLPLRIWFCAAALFLLFANHFLPDVLSGYVWEKQLWTMFLLGILLQTQSHHIRLSWLAVAAAIIWVALCYTRQMEMTKLGLTKFGIFFVMSVLVLRLGTLRWPMLRHIQTHDYSYSLYIWHWPLLLMLREVAPGFNAETYLLCASLLLMPICWFSWHYVEHPVLKKNREWLKRWRGPGK